MELGPRTQEMLHAILGREEGARTLWQHPDIDADYWDEVDERPFHYGLDGEPISMRAWAVLFEAPERLLAQEWVLGRDCERFWISTVWIGIDFNSIGRMLRDYPPPDWYEDDLEFDTRPWPFETMIFKNEPGFADVFARMGDEVLQERHATWEEALECHEACVDRVRNGKDVRE